LLEVSLAGLLLLSSSVAISALHLYIPSRTL
jgi:hypothetical protein